MLHHEALTDTADRRGAGEASLAPIEALARERFGANCRVAGYQPISARAAIVARVNLTGAPVASAIVKHLAAPAASSADLIADHPEFAHELLAYRLLALDRTHAVTPELFGGDPRGMLLLGDLGADAAPQRGFDFLVPALARALAQLHGSTAPLAAHYDVLRAEAGLVDDRRRYGVPGVRRLFQAGATRCLMHEVRAPRLTAALARELETVEAMIAEPDDFLALVHDDLANARQTVEVGGALMLVDLEQAKFSHALLDFVKPMIGKFEVDEQHQLSVWQCPAFPLALADQYRAIRAATFGTRHSDTDWNANLAAALIYGTMALIGRMSSWDPRRSLLGSRSQNINALIHRMSALLTDLEAFPAIKAFAAEFLGGLYRPVP